MMEHKKKRRRKKGWLCRVWQCTVVDGGAEAVDEQQRGLHIVSILAAQVHIVNIVVLPPPRAVALRLPRELRQERLGRSRQTHRIPRIQTERQSHHNEKKHGPKIVIVKSAVAY